MSVHDGIREMLETDLAMVRDWRNHADVRAFMYTRHEISAEEHQRWFAGCRADPFRHPLIYQQDGRAAGFVMISQLRQSRVAEWGFYLAPGAPSGTGRALGEAALEYAFQVLGLHKLCGEALGYNERSQRFHVRLGFQQEGVLRDQFHDGERYHPVICYGLLAPEWRARRRPDHE